MQLHNTDGQNKTVSTNFCDKLVLPTWPREIGVANMAAWNVLMFVETVGLASLSNQQQINVYNSM